MEEHTGDGKLALPGIGAAWVTQSADVAAGAVRCQEGRSLSEVDDACRDMIVAWMTQRALRYLWLYEESECASRRYLLVSATYRTRARDLLHYLSAEPAAAPQWEMAWENGSAVTGTIGEDRFGKGGTAAADFSGAGRFGKGGTAAAGFSGEDCFGKGGTAAAGFSGEDCFDKGGTAAAGFSGEDCFGKGGTAAVDFAGEKNFGKVSLQADRRERSAGDGETVTDACAVVLEMLQAYDATCEIVDAAGYAAQNPERVDGLPVYQKKPLPRAFVRTTEIAAPGDALFLPTLENVSGVPLTADGETYLMIGATGEAYDITREKFESLYQEAAGSVQAYCEGFSMTPKVRRGVAGKVIALAPHARLCMPRKITSVYARKLTRMTKVFSVRKPREYYLGKPGDYLTVDTDCLTSVHIVAGDVFEKTYERSKG